MPLPLLSRGRLKALGRLAALCAALPCVYFGSAALAFVLRERAANAAYASARLADLRAPTSRTRLLVFAPHCDDETLGCAGIIQQVLHAGGSVEVVLLTNGDAFRTGVECFSGKVHPTPADYERYATLRQAESSRAMQTLGLPADRLVFLGYPDGGLLRLWQSHWTATDPWVSPFTRASSSPYARCYDPRTSYAGGDVIRDIRAVMASFKPTQIAVTHPAEDHPDHAAAAWFVAAALQEIRNAQAAPAWAARARLTYYLVHRGDWPLPQGDFPKDPLTPPRAMFLADTAWSTLPLTAQEVATKDRAIHLYSSQMAMMARFLVSFARRNELFGRLSPERMQDAPPDAASSRRGEWCGSLSPILLNPVADNILRALNGGGDIRSLYAARDSDCLYLRVVCRLPVGARYTYRLDVRPFGPDGRSPDHALDVVVHGAPLDGAMTGGDRVLAYGDSVEARIPWAAIRSACGGRVAFLALGAETDLPGVMLDRTGVRIVQCAKAPPAQPERSQNAAAGIASAAGATHSASVGVLTGTEPSGSVSTHGQ